MVAYGFDRGDVGTDLALAARLGARVIEVLPDWRRYPDPVAFRARLADGGFQLHSAHGCWGGQAIAAPRVDLGEPDPAAHRAGLDDLRRCVDWLAAAGGTYLVIHPGSLSDPSQFEPRRAALARGLRSLADYARGTGVILCVENMPPGVHPGSRMADLAALLQGLDRPELALTLDTGHAHLTATTASETFAAGRLLRTTHVHDNNGRSDTHDPPGLGTIAWDDWIRALDAVGYDGPIMLECIRQLRRDPALITASFLDLLARLTTDDL
ncbi:MAG: sugar phosphate isomerase/epimerase [Isosphaeraceae bacterium]|nr:sugar phosphate isomerase/epimerase [Isosphaeraceae bacterium]